MQEIPGFPSLHTLPLPARVLFILTLLALGIAYLISMAQLWESKVGLDGNNYLTAKDLMIAYGGNKNSTQMDTALHSSMAAMADMPTKQVIITWLRNGAPKAAFDKTINPILQTHCVVCHNRANPDLPDFTSWGGLQSSITADTGMPVPTIVKISHIHLFSITFMFFLVGFIYSFAEVRATELKASLIGAPLLALILNVESVYITKVWDGFAWLIMLSGVVMGVSFVLMWGISMWQLAHSQDPGYDDYTEDTDDDLAPLVANPSDSMETEPKPVAPPPPTVKAPPKSRLATKSSQDLALDADLAAAKKALLAQPGAAEFEVGD